MTTVATLRIVHEGDLGSITASAFALFVGNMLKILRQYDVAISGERKGSLDWVITNIASGSAVLEIESRARIEEKSVGPEVARYFIDGWRQIEVGGQSPPYLSPAAMQQTRQILKLIGREGTTGFVVSDLSEAVKITPKSTVHVDELLRVRHRSIGSVEGTIETVSVHRGERFILYHARTRKAIQCITPKGRLPKLVSTELLGNRVIVFGILHSNALGEVLRIDVERVRQLLKRDAAPDYTTLGGSDPSLIGDLTTEDYIRDIRRG